MDTITKDQARAIELAIRNVGHVVEETCDYLYWLRVDSREDQCQLMSLKETVRNSLVSLSIALNPTPIDYHIIDEDF